MKTCNKVKYLCLKRLKTFLLKSSADVLMDTNVPLLQSVSVCCSNGHKVTQNDTWMIVLSRVPI